MVGAGLVNGDTGERIQESQQPGRFVLESIGLLFEGVGALDPVDHKLLSILAFL